MPSQEHEAFVAMIAASDALEAPTIEEQRQGYEDMLAKFPVADDITIDAFEIEHIAADWVTAPGADADRVVLYFHGGGYVIGSNVGYREFASRVSRTTGARVCVINYRLAPENPFPAAVDDATMAYRWLLNEGVAANQITIAGDSAGGGLTLATLLALKDAGDPLPACGVCFSPWTDLEGTGDSAKPGAVDDPLIPDGGLADMSSAYAPNDLRNPLASPLHGDYVGMPPLLIQVGTREVLLDDAVRVAEKAEAAGVDVTLSVGEGLVHVYQVFAVPESQEALDEMAAFMSERVA